MREITLKEWSAYFPYNLQVQYFIRNEFVKQGILQKITHNENETHPTRLSIDYSDPEHVWMFKPILYDLSWLTREITHEGKLVYVLPELSYELMETVNILGFPSYQNLAVSDFEILLKYKFNVFNLPDELIIKVTEDFNPYK